MTAGHLGAVTAAAHRRNPSPPSYTGPLDLTATPAVVAYGQRAMSAAKLGTAVYTIRRDSDDATQAFSSDATTGAVDAAAISAFIGGGSGFVTNWNDQSGNAADVASAVTDNQFVWQNAVIGGKPGFLGQLAGISNLIAGVNSVFSSGAATFFMVAQRGAQIQFNAMSGSYCDIQTGSNAYIDIYDGINEAGGQHFNATDNGAVHLWDAAWQFGSQNYLCDGVDLPVSTDWDSGGAVAAFSAPTSILLPPNTKCIESLVFPAILSDADRLAIRQNIAAWYGIALS